MFKSSAGKVTSEGSEAYNINFIKSSLTSHQRLPFCTAAIVS